MSSISVAKHKSIWHSSYNTFTSRQTDYTKAQSKKMFEYARPTSPEMDLYAKHENEDNLLEIYGNGNQEPCSKRIKLESTNNDSSNVLFGSHEIMHTKSEQSKSNRNPFIKIGLQADVLKSPTKLDKNNTSLLKNTSPMKRIESPQKRLPKLSKFNRTVMNAEQMVVSRFFLRNLQSDFTKTETKILTDAIATSKMIEDIEINYTKKLELSAKLYASSDSDNDDGKAKKCVFDDKVSPSIDDLTSFSYRKGNQKESDIDNEDCTFKFEKGHISPKQISPKRNFVCFVLLD